MRARLILIVVFLISVNGFAGSNRWTSNGPDGGYVAAIHVDPASPQVAFAETMAGLYRTSDGGNSWAPIAGQLGPNLSMTVATSNTAGTASTVYAWSGVRLFSSADDGDHWQALTDVPAPSINTIAFEPSSGSLYAATSAGLFISRDSGLTWNASGAPGASWNVWRITVSSTSVFLLSYPTFALQTITLLRSSDHGVTWTLVPTAPTEILYADPGQAAVYSVGPGFNGLSVSLDDGQTWKHLFKLRGDIANVMFVNSEPYVVTEAGVFTFNPNSSSVKQVGVDGALTTAEVASTTPLLIYAIPQKANEVIRWRTGDAAWTAASAGLPHASSTGVALADSQPEVAYASAVNDGLFRTTDGGKSWEKTLGFANTPGIAIDPGDPKTAFVAAGGVMKTSDAGKTWTKVVAAPSASQVALSRSDPKTLYSVLVSGLMKSNDGGKSWTAMSGVAPDYSFYYGIVYASGYEAASLVVDPADSAKVVLSNNAGIYATEDGAHWSDITGDSGASNSAIAIDGASNVFISGAKRGVLQRSGESTWSNAGLIDKSVWALAASRSSLYAGTSDGHVYRSDNGGRSWTGFDDGLDRDTIYRLAVDSTGRHLYAATAAGVYSYDVVEQTEAPERVADDPGVVDSVIEKGGFVFPVAGSIVGATASFSTELTLTNGADAPQGILVAWLPQGGSSPSTFRLTVPPGTLKVGDLGERFGVDGIGAIAVVPLDASAPVTGSLRIWTHPADGRAPLAQTIEAVPATALSPHARATVIGLAQDSTTRINAGVVNLSNETHQFTIQMRGEGGSGQITVPVPALSLLQFAMPDGDFGAVAVDASADSDARWIFFATAIDRATGQAQTAIGQTGN